MTGHNQNWRDYQRMLQKEASSRKHIRKRIRYSAAVAGIAAVVFSIHCLWPVQKPSTPVPPLKKEEPPALTKSELKSLINIETLNNIEKESFEQVSGDRKLLVETSINGHLQQLALKYLKRANRVKRGSPRYLAIVAMDPVTGKILSMAGFDKSKTTLNACVEDRFPAASVFKIITASAAVETMGYGPSSRLMFNGGKYTLYKTQLEEKKNRYTNKISFRDSFAQSVNPVFGKIGTLYLGKSVLEQYAGSFGFNQEINFEIPVSPSVISLSDDPYQWAEIACGFNRETLISPLHGALLSSAILNNGMMPEPSIIDQVIDNSGKVIYSSTPTVARKSIQPETSSVLQKLMATTIRSGTGKKSFRGYKRDPILKTLNIGGKTGSISNKSREVRLDWFVGYAEEKKGNGKIAVAVLVGHEKYIGVRAARYARMMMKDYFDQRYKKEDPDDALLAKK